MYYRNMYQIINANSPIKKLAELNRLGFLIVFVYGFSV